MQRILTIILLLANTALYNYCLAQNVPILDYSVNNLGQVQLEIEAQADQYYLLTARHEPNEAYESISSITMGVDGSMIISEPLAAYPLENYNITAHSIANPDDTDGDGIDDMTEFNNMPTDAPLNFAKAIGFTDGTTSIPDAETFASLAVVENVPWAPFLNGRQFVKFGILDKDSDEPKVYFINSNTHFIHANFFDAIGESTFQDDGSGEIVYNPNVVLPNGTVGSYSFNFSFGDAEPFESTQRTFELLAANMPFLQNNLRHFIGDTGEDVYNDSYKDDYIGSRVFVELESEVFSGIDYIPFNEAEGFGLFRQMALDENPGSRDIVLYDALPNSLPRVGGIITSVIQTPLSHVNLRAIQDNVPNAYIKEPLEINAIANLLGKYIYYKAENDSYTIREATLEEVNEWYENIRPTEEQIPDRDLSRTSILPLDSIGFDMADSFGAKCSNVATMRQFGFPEGTIPNGFGIPFYFYDEFMKFNGFYQRVEEMIADPDFIADLETRIDMLKEFRKEIKDADMPQWMLDELQEMHDSFPEGTSVRCRSSTNNEDLPGFSGAGLYTSKTQHPDEGHIQKSVKQVYASMWNFRAFDERDFYRVDHYIAAMGLLCHPNYDDEKSNGVGVSIDPLYGTENNFYLNTQVGEFLITNPDANSIPEEILLSTDPDKGFSVLRFSNLTLNGQLVMEEEYLDLMRDYLQIIHDEFAVLYDLVGVDGFGMDIEYKVTVEDQLIIKQARPWVSFWAGIKADFDLAAAEISAPQSSSTLGNEELVTVKIENRGLRDMSDFEISLLIENEIVETITISEELALQSSAEYPFTVPQDFSSIGDYNIGAIVSHPSDGYSANDTLRTVLSNLYLLEGMLATEFKGVNCGEEVELIAKVKNLGEVTFNNTEIEVMVNGLVVDLLAFDTDIAYLEEVGFPITVNENLQLEDNEISLRLVRVNGAADAVSNNNMSSITTDLENTFVYITLIVNTDAYPEETTWELYDDETNELVESGDVGLTEENSEFSQDICVDYNACFTLFVSDAYGDGICCAFGLGDFSVVNAAGEVLVANGGDFGSEAEEYFCVSGGCSLVAEITTTIASSENAEDGSMTINPSNGTEPYAYSIDGGESFVADNVFNDLAAGTYMLVVQDASENCIYEETVELGFDVMNSTENLSASKINVYPNPTEGTFTIDLLEGLHVSGEVKVEIYNTLGLLLAREVLSNMDNEWKAVISLKEHASGTYIVKCSNQAFEKYFKLIKL